MDARIFLDLKIYIEMEDDACDSLPNGIDFGFSCSFSWYLEEVSFVVAADPENWFFTFIGSKTLKNAPMTF